MIWPHLQIRKVLHLHWPGVIPEYDNIKVIFRIAALDHFCERHGHHLRRRDPVFAIKYHAVADVYHQHGGGLGLILLVSYKKIIFSEGEIIETMVHLGLPEGIYHRDVLR